MRVDTFLDNIKQNCSTISYLSVEHLLTKSYQLDDDVDKNELIEKIKDYRYFMRYLNDFAGAIYNQYQSSIDNIYIELCEFLNVNSDNEYTFNHIYKKLLNQDVDFLININDDEIKQQTINNFEKKLNMLKNSQYFQNNKSKLQKDIEFLELNLKLAKKSL